MRAVRTCTTYWVSAHAPHVLRTCSAQACRSASGGGCARQRAHGPPGYVSMTAAVRVILLCGPVRAVRARPARGLAGRQRARAGSRRSEPPRGGRARLRSSLPACRCCPGAPRGDAA
eukprot:6194931-Pleurochrysis_carterae.AAC.1